DMSEKLARLDDAKRERAPLRREQIQRDLAAAQQHQLAPLLIGRVDHGSAWVALGAAPLYKLPPRADVLHRVIPLPPHGLLQILLCLWSLYCNTVCRSLG